MLLLVIRIFVLWFTLTVVHFQIICLNERRNVEFDSTVVAKCKYGKGEKRSQAQELCNDRPDRWVLKNDKNKDHFWKMEDFQYKGNEIWTGLTEASVFVGFFLCLHPFMKKQNSFKRWFSRYFHSGRSPISVNPFLLHMDQKNNNSSSKRVKYKMNRILYSSNSWFFSLKIF